MIEHTFECRLEVVAVIEGFVDAAWLIDQRHLLDRGECAWLVAAARFDQSQEWALDGFRSAAGWLAYKLDLGRSTAHEKLRVGRQLLLRPHLAEALSSGRISYSAARIITRADDLPMATDLALIDLAEAGTILDLERMMRHLELLADQERPPRIPRMSLTRRDHDGEMASLVFTGHVIDVDEAFRVFEAYLAARDGEADASESPRGDTSSDEDETVRESPRGDSDGAAPKWGPEARAGAFMDLVRAAAGHDGLAAVGADRYLTYNVKRCDGTATLVDGTPISQATASRIACDCSQVELLVGPDGTPLAEGRRTRTWTAAQRRVARVRDQDHCRWPGCTNRIADLHHQWWWSKGGPTDIGNGFLTCRHHHNLLHDGFGVAGEADHTLTFLRRDGTPIGTTTARGCLPMEVAA